LSHRGSSSSGGGGDDPEVVRSRLTEIKDRISVLARQCEDIARRNGSDQPHDADARLPNGVPQALAHFNRSLNSYFARRFDQLSADGGRPNVRRSSNGKHFPLAKAPETDGKVNGAAPAREEHPAQDPSAITSNGVPAAVDRSADTQFAEIRKSLADIAQKIAEQSDRNQAQFKTALEDFKGHLASLVAGAGQELRLDFGSRIAALSERLYRQILSSEEIRSGVTAEGKALLDRLDRIAGLLSDKYHAEAQLLAANLEQQLKRSFSAVSLVQKSDFEVFINEFVDKIDSRLPAIAGKFSAELVDMRKSTKVVRADVDRENSGRGTVKRAEGLGAEVFVKKLQEHLDRRISEITGSNAADSSKNEQLIMAMGEQIQRELANLVDAKRSEAEAFIKDIGERVEHRILAISQYQEKADEKLASVFDQAVKGQIAKLGEIDRVIGALTERVDALMTTLAEAERASAARGAALAGSLETTAATLAQKGQAESQSLAQTFENTLLKHTNATRAEVAETAALVGSLDDKIAALAEKNRADAELLARRIRLQIESDVLKLAETTRTEIAQAIASVGTLEAKLAALADKEREDSAALQDSIQKLNEATSADGERTIGVVRALEGRLGALVEQTRSDLELLAKVLGQQIENQSQQLTESTQAQSDKTTALAVSFEHKLAAFAQSARSQSEALANALLQRIDSRAQELAENTQAEAVKTASFVESLGTDITRSNDVLRAETARAFASLEQKITAEAGKNSADSQRLAQDLGQQIERQAQALAGHTQNETARIAGLVGSLEQTVAALAERQQSDLKALADGLGQEIAGHVLRLNDSTRTAAAETRDLLGTLQDKLATLAEQGRSDLALFAQTLSQEIERRARDLTEYTRSETAAVRALFESKIADLSGKVEADTGSLRNALSRQIEDSVRQLAETARDDAAKTAMLIGSLETTIAGIIQSGFAASAELSRKLALQIESQTLASSEKIRTESAVQAALLEQKIATSARELGDTARADAARTTTLIETLGESVKAGIESSKADAELLRRDLSQQIETTTSELAQRTEQKIAALAKSSKEEAESLAQTLGQQIKTHALDLAETTRTETARATNLFEAKIAALADRSQADAEALTKAFTQQIEGRAAELSELTRAEAAKTTNTFENKLAALSDREQAAIQDLRRALSEQIDLKAQESTESARSETAKSTALLQEKITALGEDAQAQTASLAKTLREQIESHVRELSEAARNDNAKTTALIGSLDEKIVAFAEKNRVALEAQAATLAAQLKAQLTELIDANQAQNAEVKKLLDTRSEAIVTRIEALNESGLAEFQRQFKAIDEQFDRGLTDMSKQSAARTEALAETLRQRIDLGTTALIEGSRAESIAIESLLRTLTEQVYRKLVVFTDNFRSESAAGQKKLDALRESIDRRLETLAESSQEHLSRLTELTGTLGVRLDAAEGQLSRIDTTTTEAPDGVQPRTLQVATEEQSNEPTTTHLPIEISNGVKTNGSGHALITSASELHVSDEAIEKTVPATNGTNGTNGTHLDTAEPVSLHAETPKIDDPFDPFDSTRAAALVADPKSSTKRKRRLGDLLRLRFERPKL
jgi:hypothetical protein